MHPVFCTIITPDYIPFALALNQSISSHLNIPYDFRVFVSAYRKQVAPDALPHGEQMLFIDDLCVDDLGLAIYDKYYTTDKDKFRWSMKPVLMQYLLESRGYEKVIYTDWDIHFFENPLFLLELLDQHNVLLSPHFRSSDPVADYDNYILQFNSGIYNGGFIAASKGGTAALAWWAKNCLAICEKDTYKGQFVDQTHLNLMPIFFDGVYSLKHRGCNVANWNRLECRRVKQVDGTVQINDQYPIVFIHFTKSTITGILTGEDAGLMPYFKKFNACVQQHAPDIDMNQWYLMGHFQQTNSLLNPAKRKTKNIFRKIMKI